MLSRRSRALCDDDRGMTLVELVVGMTLLSIVGALALTFFVGLSTQANRVTAQTLGGSAARTALNQIETVLRLADTPTARPGYSTSRFIYPVNPSTGKIGTQLSGTDLVFFSNVTTNGRSGTAVRVPPTLIEFQLVAGVLTEYTYAPKSLSYGTNYDWTSNYNYPFTASSTTVAAPTTKTVLLTGVSNPSVFSYCSAATDVAGSCTATNTPDSIAVVQINLTLAALRGNAAQAVQSAVAITGAVS